MCPLCANFQRCRASGIAKQEVATVELAFERRKGAIKSVVSILWPSRSSDLRDKGRSALTVPRVKLIPPPPPRDYSFIVARTTLHCTSYRKWAMKHARAHTHTHTHRAANCYGSLINLCFRQNGATLTPIGLRSLKKKKKIFLKISLHFLSRYKKISGSHWAAGVCCTKRVSNHVLD